LLKIWFLRSLLKRHRAIKQKISEFFLLNPSFTYTKQAISLPGGVFKEKTAMIPIDRVP